MKLLEIIYIMNKSKSAITRILFEKTIPIFSILISISVILRSLQEQEPYLLFLTLILLFISFFATILTWTVPHIRIENNNLFIFKHIFWKPYQIKIHQIKIIRRLDAKKEGVGGFIFYLDKGTEFKYIPKFQTPELLNEMVNFFKENVTINIKD